MGRPNDFETFMAAFYVDQILRGEEPLAPDEVDWKKVDIRGAASEYGYSVSEYGKKIPGYRTYLQLQKGEVIAYTCLDGKPSSLAYLKEFTESKLALPSYVFQPLALANEAYRKLDKSEQEKWTALMKYYATLDSSQECSVENWPDNLTKDSDLRVLLHQARCAAQYDKFLKLV